MGSLEVASGRREDPQTGRSHEWWRAWQFLTVDLDSSASAPAEVQPITEDADIVISACQCLSLFKTLQVLTYNAGCSICYRQLETEMETVVKVLQPGPLGIIEHKFSAEEVRQASATVERAVQNWLRNAYQEQGSEILKDYIDK